MTCHWPPGPEGSSRSKTGGLSATNRGSRVQRTGPQVVDRPVASSHPGGADNSDAGLGGGELQHPVDTLLDEPGHDRGGDPSPSVRRLHTDRRRGPVTYSATGAGQVAKRRRGGRSQFVRNKYVDRCPAGGYGAVGRG